MVRHLLGGAGLTDAEIDAGLPRLWEHYVENLEREITKRRICGSTSITRMVLLGTAGRSGEAKSVDSA